MTAPSTHAIATACEYSPGAERLPPKNFIKAWPITVALLAAFATPVTAGPFEDGLTAANRGDFATAFRLWHPLAEQGDAHAQQNLALMYRDGQGVPQDYVEEARWYRMAAQQGHVRAQFNLGVMYGEGEGAPRARRGARAPEPRAGKPPTQPP